MNGTNLQLLGNIVRFIKHPTLNKAENDTPLAIFRRIIILISWLYVLVFPLAILITVLLKALNYSGVNAVNQFAMNGNFWTVLFLGALVAPLIEEITFRLPLRFSPTNLALSVFFALRIIASYISRQYFPHENTFLYSWIIPIIFAAVLFSLCQSPQWKSRIMDWYVQKFSVFFYSLTILFGLLHITNYSDVRNILLIIVLLGIPQIIVGIVLGYIRITYGFGYGLLMHSLYNAFLLVPASLAKDQTNQLNLILAGTIGLFVFGLVIYGFVTLIYNSYTLVKKD